MKALLVFLPVSILVSLFFNVLAVLLSAKGMANAGAPTGIALGSLTAGSVYFKAEGKRPGAARSVLFAICVIASSMVAFALLFWAVETLVFHRDALAQIGKLQQEFADAFAKNPGAILGIFGGLLIFFIAIIAFTFSMGAKPKKK